MMLGRLLDISASSAGAPQIEASFLPFLASHDESNTVTARAQSAGTMFFIISAVRSTLKASAAAIVFGFGEITFPALPPPTMASSRDETGNPARLPTASATGATVMTAISMNTPTAVTIIAASAIATIANLEPSILTIESAMRSALPVFTSAPANMPDVRMRSTLGIMD